MQTEVSHQEFLKQYEKATNSHDFSKLDAQIADDAIYWFSNGSHEGKAAIRKAIEKTWNKIQDESYSITDVEWLVTSDDYAICIYRFHWRGKVGGVAKEGHGRGTNVMVKNDGGWQMKHEHLSLDPNY